MESKFTEIETQTNVRWQAHETGAQSDYEINLERLENINDSILRLNYWLSEALKKINKENYHDHETKI